MNVRRTKTEMRRRDGNPFYHQATDEGQSNFYHQRRIQYVGEDSQPPKLAYDPKAEANDDDYGVDKSILIRVKWLLAISSFTSAMLLLILIGVAVIIPYAVKRVNQAESSIAAAVSSENVNSYASSMLHSDQVQQALHDAILSSFMNMDDEQKAKLRALFVPASDEMHAYLIEMAADPEVQKTFADVIYALLSYSPPDGSKFN